MNNNDGILGVTMRSSNCNYSGCSENEYGTIDAPQVVEALKGQQKQREELHKSDKRRSAHFIKNSSIKEGDIYIGAKVYPTIHEKPRTHIPGGYCAHLLASATGTDTQHSLSTSNDFQLGALFSRSEHKTALKVKYK
ncbi:unnamed protein product [Protopolystoma xenopodis]|uniref:Uncharacterized protein n=1 Tax=Protopolystoma xenopodis TaxID=117903 RepID=A0A448WL77_9PLAT|nr:unnamed protein product [Protopolystoma xenopodis]